MKNKDKKQKQIAFNPILELDLEVSLIDDFINNLFNRYVKAITPEQCNEIMKTRNLVGKDRKVLFPIYSLLKTQQIKDSAFFALNKIDSSISFEIFKKYEKQVNTSNSNFSHKIFELYIKDLYKTNWLYILFNLYKKLKQKFSEKEN
ncbi:hypothetical protein [Metamycoplasma hyosynoviae]|uniref:hypothetical protein n=1 Tax=Metamycoplasma hyosynoviae TaxID=29559 RepID=UPI000461DB17|nr:hypothetical protein [Metamycoplasma hyosynoviae]KDE43553.1 hypothetical protein NPL1_00400 [Metamycoplasma hyosynoviae]MDC8900529.1 hypothetical protein [Metamycoplasma hyosynoviae]MDC8911866.1 hypothetical protein [Metamycoplasma hyosynoviae]MDC8937942.1 hypothetical protein [Metamycoplasma hyosynoviae]MDD1366368.1 hypothetical protein [Metamycoplasma hyosynoviae]